MSMSSGTGGEKRAKTSWKSLCHNFTEITTYHGLRYITESTPYLIRRILWISVVTATTCAFIFFFSAAVAKYYAYQYNVNVDILYPGSMIFPSVTICNQNFIRASATFKDGAYDVMAKNFELVRHSGPQDSEQYGSPVYHEDLLEPFLHASGYTLLSITGSSPRSHSFLMVSAQTCKHMCAHFLPWPGELCIGGRFEKPTKTCEIYLTGKTNETISFILGKKIGETFFQHLMYDGANVEFLSEDASPVSWQNHDEVYHPLWDANLDFYVSKWAHQREDLIHSCIWNGRPCNNSDFRTVNTDFGVCQEFQSQFEDDSYFKVTQPGPNFGLQLVLNVEEYDHMTGPNTNMGLKVYLHTPGDIALVRDLGFEVSPGKHSSVFLQTQQMVNLGSPHGQCGEKELRLYRNETYSWCRCMRECESISMYNKCKCRDIYMYANDQGLPRMCNISEYFNCVQQSTDDVLRKAKSCQNECVTQCTYYIYEPRLFQTEFSKKIVDTRRSSAKKRTKERRKEALDIQLRANGVDFLALTQTLTDIWSAYESLITLLETKVTNMERSYLYLSETLSQFVAIFDSDFNEIVFENWASLTQNLGAILGPSKNTVQRYAEEMFKFGEEFVNQVHLLRSTDNTDYRLALLDYYSSFHQKALLLDKSISAFFNMSLDIKFFARGIGLNETMIENLPASTAKNTSECQEILVSFHEGLAPLDASALQLYNMSLGKINSHMFPAVTVAFSNDLFTAKHKFGTFWYICLTPFFGELETIRRINASFHEVTEDVYKLDLSYDYNTVTAQVQNDMDRLRAISHAAIHDGTFGLEQMTDVFTDTFISNLDSHQIRMKDKTKERVTEIARTKLDIVRPVITSWYTQTIQAARAVDFYNEPIQVTPKLQSMKIMRWPMISPLSSRIIYRYNETEGTNHWISQNLSSLPIESKVAVIVNNFVSQLLSLVDEFDDEMDTMSQTLSGALGRAGDLMSTYRDKQHMDEDFARKNIVALDIFYPEIQMQRVSQVKAYGPSDLLGDVGGYMGLLLGASIVTLFEVADLIFYNGLMKFVYFAQRRQKGQKNKVHTEHSDVATAATPVPPVYTNWARTISNKSGNLNTGITHPMYQTNPTSVKTNSI